MPSFATIGSQRFELTHTLATDTYSCPVFEGVDLATQETVAVKVGQADDDLEQRQFAHEAEILQRFSHDQIPTLRAVGQASITGKSQDTITRPALVLEHGGVAMQTFMGDMGLQGASRLALKTVVKVGSELASVLQHVHDEGILHRDLKPGNVTMGKASLNKAAMLIDFGEAVPLESASSEQKSMGTPGYAAPELKRRATARSDIFSLASTLHTALTGEYPYPLGRWRRRRPPVRQFIPDRHWDEGYEEVCEVINKGQRVRSRGRHANAAEFGAELTEAYHRGTTTAAAREKRIIIS